MMGQISKNANSQETIWCSFSGSGVDDIIIKLCAKGIFILGSYLYRRKRRTKEYLSDLMLESFKYSKLSFTMDKNL